MADVTIAPAANAAEITTPKKASKKAAKSSRPKASHPPTAVMVTNAIKNLKERGGSSLQAIKKYITSTYKVDAEKLAPFIKKFLKASVASGNLVQTKGKGASGSFKLSSGTTGKAPSSPGVTKVAKKPAAKKPSKPKAKSVEKPAIAKKSPVKKAAKPKRGPPTERKIAVAVPKPKVAKPKSPAKAKKAVKTPTKKPRTPKPKTTKAKSPAKAAKRGAPKKK